MVKGYGKYTQQYQQTAVNTVDQKKLIVMLYDGAIKFLSMAVEKIESGESYEAHTNLVRGKSIIAELLASLNLEMGGEIAQNLQRLYAYMFNELIEANLNKDATRVNHVIQLLKELRVGWQSMKAAGDDAEQGQGQAQGQGRPQGGPAGTKRINLRG